jgi:hypothetical protein
MASSTAPAVRCPPSRCRIGSRSGGQHLGPVAKHQHRVQIKGLIGRRRARQRCRHIGGDRRAIVSSQWDGDPRVRMPTVGLDLCQGLAMALRQMRSTHDQPRLKIARGVQRRQHGTQQAVLGARARKDADPPHPSIQSPGR